MTISTLFGAANIAIGSGSLTIDPGFTYHSTIEAYVGLMYMSRVLNDTRVVNLDGIVLKGVKPSISCNNTGDSFAETGDSIVQRGDGDVIINDPGYIGTSANLQDICAEGSARGYARKVSNGVRYLTVSVMIRASMPHYVGRLYRMASSPFQVLLVTTRSVIKGYIETIAPDSSYVGTEYIALKVTVAEGL